MQLHELLTVAVTAVGCDPRLTYLQGFGLKSCTVQVLMHHSFEMCQCRFVLPTVVNSLSQALHSSQLDIAWLVVHAQQSHMLHTWEQAAEVTYCSVAVPACDILCTR